MTIPAWRRRLASIDAARWRALEGVLEHALDLPDAERAAFLARACGGDIAMREDLEALLAAERESGAFLERPAAALAPGLLADAVDAADSPMEGRRVGAWRLVREIGRGGMGTVYLAERGDGGFQQQAALKMLRRGLDTDDILARFRRERQILAGLEHPNVARLLDGGATDDGRPYFVMEYVEGEPLAEHVRRHALDLAGTLRRFLQVCDAVQHAHRALVVHRDLKPANLLVTADGQVKLLDFGVAHLLGAGDGGDATRSTERRLTPDYAAPEQIRGERTTTSTDVYGLGVVLYELLSGDRPHRRTGASLAQLEQAVLKEEPPPPSVVLARTPHAGHRAGWHAQIRGDLDRIVLKALRRDPAERYATAEALRADLERFLAGEPVLATAPTWRYRAGKFFGRHRAGVAAATVVVVSLVAGLAAVAWQARIAARERDRAVSEARKASTVKDFLIGLFRAGDPYMAAPIDTTLTALGLIDRGVHRVRTEMADEPEVQAEMMDLLGAIERDAGRFDVAESLMTSAHAIRVARHGPESAEAAATLNSLGTLHWARGDHAEAESVLTRALAIQRARDPQSDAVLQTLTTLTGALRGSDQRARAESTYHESIALAEALHGPDDPETALQLNNYGSFLQQSGRPRDAREALARALAIRVERLGPLHINTAVTAENLALAVTELGELDRADSLYGRARIARERWLEPGHPDLARIDDSMALLARQQGRFARAESLHLKALDLRRQRLGPDHPDVAISLNNLAVAYYVMLRLEPAVQAFEEVHARWAATLGPDHVRTLTALNNLGAVRREQGRWAESERILNDVFARRVATTGADAAPAGFSHHNLGQLAFARGRLDEAERHARRAVAIRHRLAGEDGQTTIQSTELLASVLRDRGRTLEADTLYRRALVSCRRVFTQPNPLTADVLVGLGRLESSTERATAARPHLEEALTIRRGCYEPGDPRTGEAMVALGRCLVVVGDPEAARPLLEQGLAAMRKRPGRQDPLIAAGVASLGRLVAAN